jgi:hypothetical protein
MVRTTSPGNACPQRPVRPRQTLFPSQSGLGGGAPIRAKRAGARKGHSTRRKSLSTQAVTYLTSRSRAKFSRGNVIVTGHENGDLPPCSSPPGESQNPSQVPQSVASAASAEPGETCDSQHRSGRSQARACLGGRARVRVRNDPMSTGVEHSSAAGESVLPGPRKCVPFRDFCRGWETPFGRVYVPFPIPVNSRFETKFSF